MKNKITNLCMLILLSVSSGFAQVQIPQLMNYQGQLADASGNPLPTADYSLTFSIYDAAQGGALVWGPQIFNGTTGAGRGAKIPVVQGYFNVMLGPTDTTSRPLGDAFAANAIRFVEIQVGTNAPLAPRQQLLTAPFAFAAGKAANADKLQGFDWSSLYDNGNPTTGKINGAKLANSSVTTNHFADSAVDNAKIADGAVDAAKIANGSVTFTKRNARDVVSGAAVKAGDIVRAPSSELASGNSATFTLVPNQTITIITNGGPVLVTLAAKGGDHPANISVNGAAGSSYVSFRLFRDDNVVGTVYLGSVGNTLSVPPGSVVYLDKPTAGPHTYQLKASYNGTGNWYAEYVSLVAVEL